MEFDPHSVSASPIHLSPDRRGEETSAKLAPFGEAETEWG